MEISTYFIWIFMTCSVSLVQTEELPQLKVFIQYTTGTRLWRLDKQNINSTGCEEMIQSALEYLKLNVNKNVVHVRVGITDCETGNSSRVENIVREINHCSYHGSGLFPHIEEKSCFKVHFKILKMYELPNCKKKCDDWPEKLQESYGKEPVKEWWMEYSSRVFIEVLLLIILLGVLLVIMLIFVNIKMRLTGKSTYSIKDPSYFGSFAPFPFYRGSKPPAGDDEEAQNRLILDLTSEEADGDDDDEGQDRLSAGLNPTEGKSTNSINKPPNFAGDEEAQNRLISEEGRCTKSMDFPPTMAGDDGDDEGQNRLVAGLTPARQSWNSRNVSAPNLAFGRNYQ